MDQTDPALELPELNLKQTWFFITEIALCFVALSFNFFLFFFLCWSPKRTFSKTYLIFALNLAFWDLLFSGFLFSASVRKLVQRRLYMHMSECVVEGMGNEILGLNSLCAIMLQSLDRYVIVVKKRPMPKKTATGLILLCTLASCMVGSSPLLFNAARPFVIQPSKIYCLLDLSRSDPHLANVVYAPAVIYASCLLFIMKNYAQILYEISRSTMGLKSFKITRALAPSRGEIISNPMGSTAVSNRPPGKSSEDLGTQAESNGENGVPREPAPGAAKHDPVSPQARRLSATRRPSAREISLTMRTILIGSTHITLYIPFAICGIMQMLQFEQLEDLDFAGIYCIFFCFIMDPFWTLALDTNVHKSMDDFANLFTK